jgi:RNA polymerase sigma-70 factor (ECF subfamily)
MNEETQIVKELASGSHEAFKTLYTKYYPKVKYFITHLIKTEAIAAELSQDVFLKIWEHRAKMAALQSFNAYVYRAAKNTALNYLEHKYIEDMYVEKFGSEPEPSDEDEWKAKEIELLEQLTVSRMPPQRKAVYEMSRMEGLSNEAIAAKLGVSKKTVENHLNLALKELRKALKIITLFFG